MTSEQMQFIERMYMEMFDNLRVYANCQLMNESLAEEAVQETFRIACLKAESFRTSENPKGWLVKTLKYTICNINRNRENTNRVLTTYIASQGDVDYITNDRLSLEVTYGKLAESDDFRLIKEMAVDGKSHLEMAQSRGISVSACKKRVQRAKENLKKEIKL